MDDVSSSEGPSFDLTTNSDIIADLEEDVGLRQLWQELHQLCSGPRNKRDPFRMACYLDLKLELAVQQLAVAGRRPFEYAPDAPSTPSTAQEQEEELPAAACGGRPSLREQWYARAQQGLAAVHVGQQRLALDHRASPVKQLATLFTLQDPPLQPQLQDQLLQDQPVQGIPAGADALPF
ncbi:hypothetical protein WJX73_003350 [Symbiochloris irregularis]|uniref:Uncharacterized protein n=1 Tax=Symbiochloris irregularis TaxID=706552 RepID=A0AAW1PWC5_9CHLO